MSKKLIFENLIDEERDIVDAASKFVALTQILGIHFDLNQDIRDEYINEAQNQLNYLAGLGYTIEKQKPGEGKNNFGIDISAICPRFEFKHTEKISFSFDTNFKRADIWFHHYEKLIY